MKKKNRILIIPLVIMGAFLILANSCKKPNDINNPIQTGKTVTDTDGNVYSTVTIGTQVWMVENLRTTHYRDGTAIPNITDSATWVNLNTGAYCDYNNSLSNSKIYGRLYNWYAATSNHNLCPKGWHVPSDAEWTTLTDYLGGLNVAGHKLKETGPAHWQYPNPGATNEVGFSALPGGLREDGKFYELSSSGYWWCSTEFDPSSSEGWNRDIYLDNNMDRESKPETEGLSIRCLKD